MRSYYKVVVIWILITLPLSCSSQGQSSLKYIDSNKPDKEARVFAPNFISKENVYEFGSIFSKDGTEFYFALNAKGKEEIKYSKLEGNKWTEPKTIISDETYGFNDPFLSPNENKLFYISNLPRNEMDTINDIDIWYSEKEEDGWSKPINAGAKINSDRNEYYISFTSSGKMYFASNKNAEEGRLNNFDVYSSARVDGNFESPVKLSDSINTKDYEADVFVAPDESFLIFSSERREGLGQGDLYISFKDKNGEWEKAKNMGDAVNTTGHELCPFVTSDGKYLFYTSKKDIYWISAEILNSLK